MSTNTTEGNQSYPHDRVEQLISKVDELMTTVADQGERIDELEATVEEQADEIEELQAQVESNADEIEDNEEQIGEVDEQHGQNVAGCHARINKVEDEIDDMEPQDARKTDPSDSSPKGEAEETTALERVCSLPEHVVADNLTANQRRARSVARRIEEYGKKVPAGVAITSSRIKRVLTAQEDSTIHRQTVSRVADFLERFGDGSVQIKETRGGKTTVVFGEGLVESVTSVVTDQEPDGVTPAVI